MKSYCLYNFKFWIEDENTRHHLNCHGYEYGPRDLSFFIINSSTTEMTNRTSFALFTYLQDFLSLLKQFNRKFVFFFLSWMHESKHCVNIDKYNGAIKDLVSNLLWKLGLKSLPVEHWWVIPLVKLIRLKQLIKERFSVLSYSS